MVMLSTRKSLPATGTQLCSVASIPDGGCIGYRAAEPEKLGLMICRSGDAVYAYVNICPHLSLPLDGERGEFMIDGPQQVMCAYHCAVFRFTDGLCVQGPARTLHLDAVPIEVIDGHVVVGAT